MSKALDKNSIEQSEQADSNLGYAERGRARFESMSLCEVCPERFFSSQQEAQMK